MRELRGPRAVQSVKQYNFISEFRDLIVEAENQEFEDESCVSRWLESPRLLPALPTNRMSISWKSAENHIISWSLSAEKQLSCNCAV